ncbi:MAG: shikimate kinase [Cellulosilyticaceae bacterium]
MNNNIYLIGFMGCGKTTIGHQVAIKMQSEFIDLDREIENREKASIPHLFKMQGEDYFREVESLVLLQTKERQGCVIATGGGTVSKEINREFLKRQKTIYLEWDFDTLYERIKNDSNRPNVKSYGQLEELYESRLSFYESAGTCCINCENKSRDEIVLEIISGLGGEL